MLIRHFAHCGEFFTRDYEAPLGEIHTDIISALVLIVAPETSYEAIRKAVQRELDGICPEYMADRVERRAEVAARIAREADPSSETCPFCGLSKARLLSDE
jgi:hypothetical protein